MLREEDAGKLGLDGTGFWVAQRFSAAMSLLFE
jgi:hypothetical protein